MGTTIKVSRYGTEVWCVYLRKNTIKLATMTCNYIIFYHVFQPKCKKDVVDKNHSTSLWLVYSIAITVGKMNCSTSSS